MGKADHSLPETYLETHDAFWMGLLVVTAGLAASGCFGLRTSHGGGLVDSAAIDAPRTTTTQAIAPPSGDQIEAVARGLTMPSGVEFVENGGISVSGSGCSSKGGPGAMPAFDEKEIDGEQHDDPVSYVGMLRKQ